MAWLGNEHCATCKQEFPDDVSGSEIKWHTCSKRSKKKKK